MYLKTHGGENPRGKTHSWTLILLTTSDLSWDKINRSSFSQFSFNLFEKARSHSTHMKKPSPFHSYEKAVRSFICVEITQLHSLIIIHMIDNNDIAAHRYSKNKIVQTKRNKAHRENAWLDQFSVHSFLYSAGH